MKQVEKGIIKSVLISLIVWAILFFPLHFGKPETLYLEKSKLEKYKQLNAWTISITISVFVLMIMLSNVYRKNKKYGNI